MTTLRELGAEVSLLVRTSKCNNCTRSPPTAVLRKSFNIFEYDGSHALAALNHQYCGSRYVDLSFAAKP